MRTSPAARRRTWRSSLAADASWEAANACLQFHGGFGFANEYDVERKFRETRLYQVAPISTNLILRTSPSTCLDCRVRSEPRDARTGRHSIHCSRARLNMPVKDTSPTATLARFASALRFDDIPAPVVRRAEDFLLDWLGSALAGKGARAVEAVERFACAMGPSDGASEVLISRRRTSPLFAAMVNAAASHFAEQDDVHNGSVFHPGAVVFPPALAVAQACGCSGRDSSPPRSPATRSASASANSSASRHYKVFHTTGTAGTVAAAAAAGRVLGLSTDTMQHAFGSAGTQAAGLWEFLRDAADSKQLHTAKAAATAHRRVSRAGRIHRRRSTFSKAHRAWQPGCRPMPTRRASPTGSGSAWRSPKRSSNSTRRAGTRIPRPTRC